MITKKNLQEKEYNYPYHYNSLITPHSDIPYQLLIEYIIRKLLRYNFNLVADVGCGDGFLIYKFKKFKKCIEGYDFSSKAISLAKALNPNISFYNHDITESPLKKKYDILILQDVIEHIDPFKLKRTIKNLYRSLNKGGRIFLIVPTKIKKIPDKHYKHYNLEDIKEVFKNFEIESYTYLYSKIKYKNFWYKIFLWLSDCTIRPDIFKYGIYKNILILTKRYYQNNIFKSNPINGQKLFIHLQKVNSD